MWLLRNCSARVRAKLYRLLPIVALEADAIEKCCWVAGAQCFVGCRTINSTQVPYTGVLVCNLLCCEGAYTTLS